MLTGHRLRVIVAGCNVFRFALTALLGALLIELIFLTLLANGLETDPHAAMQATLAAIGTGGQGPVKLTCVLADGDRLYGFRHASAGAAPTLYASVNLPGGGQALASEPLCGNPANWVALPEDRIVAIDQVAAAA